MALDSRYGRWWTLILRARNSPKIKIHFIAHVQLNSREDQETGRQKNWIVFIWISFTAFFYFHRLLKQHKFSMKNNLSINILGSSNRELLTSICGVERMRKKWKSEEIHKSTSRWFSFQFWWKNIKSRFGRRQMKQKSYEKAICASFSQCLKVFSSIKSRLS